MSEPDKKTSGIRFFGYETIGTNLEKLFVAGPYPIYYADGSFAYWSDGVDRPAPNVGVEGNHEPG